MTIIIKLLCYAVSANELRIFYSCEVENGCLTSLDAEFHFDYFLDLIIRFIESLKETFDPLGK